MADGWRRYLRPEQTGRVITTRSVADVLSAADAGLRADKLMFERRPVQVLRDYGATEFQLSVTSLFLDEFPPKTRVLPSRHGEETWIGCRTRPERNYLWGLGIWGVGLAVLLVVIIVSGRDADRRDMAGLAIIGIPGFAAYGLAREAFARWRAATDHDYALRFLALALSGHVATTEGAA
jgi:hypothetical protein